MIAYENDVLTIPKKYKKMSVSELEREKARLLKEIKASVSQKKQVRTNKKNFQFFFDLFSPDLSFRLKGENLKGLAIVAFFIIGNRKFPII